MVKAFLEIITRINSRPAINISIQDREQIAAARSAAMPPRPIPRDYDRSARQLFVMKTVYRHEDEIERRSSSDDAQIGIIAA